MTTQEKLKKDPVIEWFDRRITEAVTLPKAIRISRDKIVITRDEEKEVILEHLKEMRKSYITSVYPELDEFRLYGGKV